ncbi:SLC13 family permease [Corynebacterium timonense]|uniref:Na+/H+ antiporter NhaD n=1 Tax=Corynebacterium timonense TaxID=441500 RepID=A0A1H1R591_9CORY|nr:SLC13 family permease [Corynebacterium timonense]SDS30882.1 Na+/H+ antiporter NhaD [Corynebacterium timonense]
MPIPRAARVVSIPSGALLLFAVLAATDHEAARGVAGRLAPVLGFAAGMSVAVNLAAEAGVFDTLAGWVEGARHAFPAFLALCVAVTVFLSLDTTAIMLTPLAIALARRAGASVTALSLAVVWIANLASLPLPVSNLTNLLALDAFGGTYGFLSRSWAPALVGITVAVAASYAARAIHPADPVAAPPRDAAAPRVPLLILAVAVAALLTPIPFWVTSTVAAAAMAAAVGVVKRPGLIPWNPLALVVAVACATELLPPFELGWPLPLAGAVLANALNNLPAYLLLEPADATQRMQLLVGVNFGPLVTPWASLATLLWHDQLKRAGADLPWRVFVVYGAILAPVAVGLGALVVSPAGN